MSGERECDLRGKVRELERDLAAARAEVARLREESLRGHWDDYSSIKEGQREIAELRAEAEHLKGSEKSFCEDRNAWRARAERAEAEVETLREALAFIAKHGGISHDTEEGTIYCNGPWCAEQARAALDAARAKGGRS
jgi:chromosome segregation ATPase